MAKKKTVVAPAIEDTMRWQDRLRFIGGIVLLFLGSFLTLTVISYFTSWKTDESAISSSETYMNFIVNNDAPIENWGGRIGAVVAHLLVKKSMGVVALFFTLWIAAIGINLIYNQYKLPVYKWLRWMALGFLFICPLLSLIFVHSDFPFGGVLGNELINWTNGAAGLTGTILMLLFVFFVFVIMIFQWDLRPYWNTAKDLFPKRNIFKKEDITQPENEPLDEDDLIPAIATVTTSNQNTSNYPFNNQYEESVEAEASTLMIDDEYESNNDEMLDGIKLVEGNDEQDNELSASIQSEESIFSLEKKGGLELELPEVIEDEAEEINIPSETTSNKRTSKVYIGTTNSDTSNETEEEKELSFIINTPNKEEEINLPANSSLASKEEYAPELDLPRFKFPTLDLMDDMHMSDIALDREELQKNKEQIINTLRSFGIEIQKIEATVGPTVTLYEIVPVEGIRISKIRNLEDDIALNLAALGIRMIAPIPGKGTIGIEVPNVNKQIVPMRSLLSSDKFIHSTMSLPIALGKKIDNENYIVDLAAMPHLLMAGATGQGKSVGINAILTSLLYKKHPSQLKFVLVDPKKVELSIYKLIENHYLAMLPNEEEAIITDTKKVINTLNSLTIEMDNRYELLKEAGARNIKEYNKKFIDRRLNPNKGHKFLPFIVLVIDEFADLIMTAGKEVEAPVARLAQLARAVGIHLIVATQRPSVNVITGIIKANFPARIAFRVTSKVDSRTILDTGGADQLVGKGDMLVSYGSELLRVQCAFIDTPEVERIVEFIGNQNGYPTPFLLPEYEGAEDEGIGKEDVDLSKRDKMFEECARLVLNSQSGSTSMLQRKFNIGFNRAGRIMDQLEAAGIVGPQVGSKPRDVMVSTEYELENIFAEINAKP